MSVQTTMRQFLFVGEKPSDKALELGATWRKGGQCATTLHSVLHRLGIHMREVRFTNLFTRTPDNADGVIRSYTVSRIRRRAREGFVIVGMGQLVHTALCALGINHRHIVHPAARGVIRRKDTYVEHVRGILEDLLR